MGFVLILARACVLYNPGEREIRVFGRLGKAACKIVEAAGEPGIVLAESIDAQGNELAREEFSEGRGNRFRKRARGNKVDVRLHGIARGGQDAMAADGFLGRKTRGFNQAKPLLDAPGARAVTIVIDDAFAPSAAEVRIFRSREEGRVFNRDSALVIIAIEGPGLKLAARQLALMHQKMKWVPVVVTLFADGVKAGDEI